MADVLFTNVRIFDGGGETPFQGDALDGFQAGLVVPGEMRVRLHHAGHEESARSVDHLCTGHRQGP